MNDLPFAAKQLQQKRSSKTHTHDSYIHTHTTQLELSEVEINNMSHWINEWQKSLSCLVCVGCL